MLNLNPNRLINHNSRVLLKKIESMLRSHNLKANASKAGTDFIILRVNSTDYGLKLKKDSVVLAWNRPFMFEKTVREFETLSEALKDLDKCFYWHNYLSDEEG